MATRKTTSTRKSAPRTRLIISGRGLAFSVLDLDRESFLRFTQTGIDADEFDDLKRQLTEAGDCITAPFLGETTVSVDGTLYQGTWDAIKSQVGKRMPPATKIYEQGADAYSVIMEVSVEGEFVRTDIAGFDPKKLSFDLEPVELAKDRKFVLLDPYYGDDFLAVGDTDATGIIYVVDAKGKRFDLKRI
jgi:hypothetical protein